jgi:hypothetical protein
VVLVDPVVPAGVGAELAELAGADRADVTEQPGRLPLVRHRDDHPVPRDPGRLAVSAVAVASPTCSRTCSRATASTEADASRLDPVSHVTIVTGIP